MNTILYSLLVGIDIAAITLLIIVIKPYLKRSIFNRPKLEIELRPAEGFYLLKKWQVNEKKNTEEPIYVYEACWCYDIVIKNVSAHDAFSPVIKSNLALPYSTQMSSLNPFIPIRSASQATINVTYKVLHQSTESKRLIPEGIPAEIRKVKFLLEYANEHGKKFYTVFECKTDSNTKHFTRPSGF
ncbi:MAG: hypothetical protein MUE96_11000 [Bacteroidia bacterium]|jgi:hypothetical protein|nr:hypothetical protein [Bacteroidia bacterium]